MDAVTVCDDAPDVEGEDGRWECAVWKEVVLGVDVDASLSAVPVSMVINGKEVKIGAIMAI